MKAWEKAWAECGRTKARHAREGQKQRRHERIEREAGGSAREAKAGELAGGCLVWGERSCREAVASGEGELEVRWEGDAAVGSPKTQFPN